METELKPGDRVVGIGKGVIVAVVDDNDPPVATQRQPIYFVRYDNPELQEIGNEAGALAHRGSSKLRLDTRPSEQQYCPECDEEDFFLREDYICAACRFALLELND